MGIKLTSPFEYIQKMRLFKGQRKAGSGNPPNPKLLSSITSQYSVYCTFILKL